MRRYHGKVFDSYSPVTRKEQSSPRRCYLFYVVSLLQITSGAVKTTCLSFWAQRKDLWLSKQIVKHKGQKIIWLTSPSCKGKKSNNKTFYTAYMIFIKNG